MISLATSARALLRENDRGTYTVPSARLYPHQWAWDSAFAALGWLQIDPPRALLELETLLAGQWADGRVPHIYFHHPEGSYFPPPSMWGRERSSTITQPPVWATVARKLLEAGLPAAALGALVPRIDASHAFFHAQRDPLGYGLISVTHPWESGLDNAPSWDVAMKAIDPSSSPPLARVDKGRVKHADQRPSDDDYRRYLVLVKAIEANDFGPSPFQVYDPFMTAILAKAETDLAWLGQALGVPTQAAARAARLRAGLLERLWSPELGRFRLLDASSGLYHSPDVLGSYMPLILDLPADVADSLRATLRSRFWTPFPLPTTAPDAPEFNPVCYWRGPSWVNMNWLLAPAVGDDLIDRTLELLEREGFWEYFHPITGEPLGSDAFTWSAALALDWLADR